MKFFATVALLAAVATATPTVGGGFNIASRDIVKREPCAPQTMQCGSPPAGSVLMCSPDGSGWIVITQCAREECCDIDAAGTPYCSC
jgi:hypothetical protein